MMFDIILMSTRSHGVIPFFVLLEITGLFVLSTLGMIPNASDMYTLGHGRVPSPTRFMIEVIRAHTDRPMRRGMTL